MTTTCFEDANLQALLERIAKDEAFKQPTFSISAGCKPGDNYCCRIYRVLITEAEPNNDTSLSLIFKVSIPRKSSQTNAMFRGLNEKEAFVYKTVLPTLNNVLKTHGISKSDIFPGTGRCFASHLDDSCQLLVLEDKCTDGFRTLGDVKSLDANHCRPILQKIAMWHAASVALRQHQPEAFENIEKYLQKENAYDGHFDSIFEEMKEGASKGIKLLPESFKKGSAYKNAEKAVENFLKEVSASSEVPPDFSCIIHGDCWFNNVLYKYDQDNVLQDVCLIDFQATRLASPAAELSYMFFASTTKEMRDESYDDLIQFYHNELSSFLKKMDCDPEMIPLKLLEEHMTKYGQIGPLVAIAGSSIFLIDCSEETIHLKFSENEDSLYGMREKLPPDPARKEIMEKVLMNVITDTYERGFFMK